MLDSLSVVGELWRTQAIETAWMGAHRRDPTPIGVAGRRWRCDTFVNGGVRAPLDPADRRN